MRKLFIAILATAALAAPTAASAHHRHGFHHHHAVLAKLTGTGTSFGGTTATASGTLAGKSDKLASGTFAVSLTNDATKATTKTFDRGTLTCMPATAALSLKDSASAANTVTATLTGKTCSWTKTGSTDTVRAFFGRGTATGAGTLAGLTGKTAKTFLVQKADGSVKGAVFAGHRGLRSLAFSMGEREARHQAGCDNDH
jgi:hypothetical protein